MEKKNFFAVGGDRRQRELVRLLREEGHRVHTLALEKEWGEPGEIGGADCVVLPLPALSGQGAVNTPLWEGRLSPEEVLDAMTPGQLLCAGMVTEELERMAEERGIVLRDYFAREELAVLNAVPTAEGAIRIALGELPITLHEASVLILGFGRIGRALLPRLRGLGARVTVAARGEDDRAEARAMGAVTGDIRGLVRWMEGSDLVFNTVPAPVLGRRELAAAGPGALVIDLASAPGGTDFGAGEELGVRCIHALGLPGKEAPATAGQYIMDTVCHIMEELEV